MAHAKSLRVIGQSLESARVIAFELKKDAQDYLVESESLTPTGEWILRNLIGENILTDHSVRSSASGIVRFTPLDISKLDSYWQKQRRNHSSSQTQGSSKLSQLLRSLGDHLDRAKASSFHLSWAADAVSVDYRDAEGLSESRTFTCEKLQQLGLHTRFRRSSQSADSSSTNPSRRSIR